MKSLRFKGWMAPALGMVALVTMNFAAATCTNSTPFVAWSSWNPNTSTNVGAAFGGSTVAADGLNSTSCSMGASFTTALQSLGESARVYDTSPTAEQTYRFRFYIDPTNIATTSLTTLTSVEIFLAQSGTNHGATTPNNGLVRMYLVGDGTGNVYLRTYAACSTGDNALANRCRSLTGDVLLTGSSERIEGQLIIGGAGTGIVNIWVGTNTGTPDSVINVDNSAWGSSDGVETANMGLFQSTTGFQTAFQNQVVRFDEFDSRRQTAIGP